MAKNTVLYLLQTKRGADQSAPLFVKIYTKDYSTYLGLIGSFGVSTTPWRTCERLTE